MHLAFGSRPRRSGAPLVNLAVDRYHQAGRSSAGISFFLVARDRGAKNLQVQTERLAYRRRRRGQSRASPPPSRAPRFETQAPAAPPLARMDAARESTEALKGAHPRGPKRRSRNVIVATAQPSTTTSPAKAAAFAVADNHRPSSPPPAHRSSTNVPHGATTDGTRPTFATQ